MLRVNVTLAGKWVKDVKANPCVVANVGAAERVGADGRELYPMARDALAMSRFCGPSFNSPIYEQCFFCLSFFLFCLLSRKREIHGRLDLSIFSVGIYFRVTFDRRSRNEHVVRERH